MTDDEREPSIDELYEQSLGAEDELPADDSDLEGDEDAAAEAEDQTPDEESDDSAPPGFDPESYLKRVEEHFQKNVLPQYSEQVLREAMNRTRQSQRAREQEIQKQLAPLIAYLSTQEQQGLASREDSQRAIQQQAQKLSQEMDAAESAQQQADLRQQWLALQQQPAPQEVPVWVSSTEARLNQVVERSGLDETDPEFAKLPSKITHSDPNEAIEYMELKVAALVQEKEKRLAQNGQAPTRKPKPFVDMGAGGSPGSANPIAGIEDIDQLWQMGTRGGNW